ncbi:MAG: nitroreductase family protein [Chloroflexi bacterium HGW-Chloroflexi-4]|jgi:nitroreductase|nr:MAG: nitroreductase family protein [Chloroflexi bacterium HGW-Chloroflexi-4]
MTKTGFEPLAYSEKSTDEMITISQSFYLEMKNRRSVRDFSNRPIPEEVIMNAISAAGTAPSGANMQPWHFVVITDPEIKKEIRIGAENEERRFYQERATKEWLGVLKPLGIDASKPFLEIAPCLIVIFLKTKTVKEDGVTCMNYYQKESTGIATGILITALHLSGLAILTYTPSPMKFLNHILDRPATEHPFLLLATGYPSNQTEVPTLEKYELERIATFL